jgi:hypothetical protein
MKLKLINEDEKNLIVKISCDGTNLTQSRFQLLNLTFTIINSSKNCKTASGNFILGNFRIESENHEELKEALKEVFTEIKLLKK